MARSGKKTLIGIGLVSVVAVAGLVFSGKHLLAGVIWVTACCAATLYSVGHIYRKLRGRIERVGTQLAAESFAGSIIARESDLTLMPISNFSIKAVNLNVILDVVRREQPESIVELGSGMTTLQIAHLLKKSNRKAKFVSYESDRDWLDLCQHYVDLNDLTDWVELRHAPLKQWDSERQWYDLESSLGDIETVDFLIVDGPPRRVGHLARKPALNVFHGRMKKGSKVFLDDAGRPEEMATGEAWLREYSGLRCFHGHTVSGYKLFIFE